MFASLSYMYIEEKRVGDNKKPGREEKNMIA